MNKQELAKLQKRDLVRAMVEQATYSQEQLIFYININPQLYNVFLSGYYINQNRKPMEYSVNGDMVTIVHPVVLLTGICDTPVFAKKPTEIVGVLIISGGVRFYHDQPHTNSNFTGNLQGFVHYKTLVFFI